MTWTHTTALVRLLPLALYIHHSEKNVLWAEIAVLLFVFLLSFLTHTHTYIYTPYARTKLHKAASVPFVRLVEAYGIHANSLCAAKKRNGCWSSKPSVNEISEQQSIDAPHYVTWWRHWLTSPTKLQSVRLVPNQMIFFFAAAFFSNKQFGYFIYLLFRFMVRKIWSNVYSKFHTKRQLLFSIWINWVLIFFIGEIPTFSFKLQVDPDRVSGKCSHAIIKTINSFDRRLINTRPTTFDNKSSGNGYKVGIRSQNVTMCMLSREMNGIVGSRLRGDLIKLWNTLGKQSKLSFMTLHPGNSIRIFKLIL